MIAERSTIHCDAFAFSPTSVADCLRAGIGTATALARIGSVSPFPPSPWAICRCSSRIHRGFFKDESIEIEIPMMLPQLAHNALLSGEVDYHGVADSALRLAARGAPMKSIFFGAMRPNYFLMAKPQIKSIRRTARQIHRHGRFGDTIELASRIALNREGLDLQRDAVLDHDRLPGTRVAALSAGSIDATIVVPPDNVLLRQKGFRELLFLGDAVEFPSNGFSTTERQLDDKRDLTKRTCCARSTAVSTFARERATTRSRSSNGNGGSTAPPRKESYASLAKSFSRDGTASNAGLKFHIEQIQRAEKTIGDITDQQDRRLPAARRSPPGDDKIGQSIKSSFDADARLRW